MHCHRRYARAQVQAESGQRVDWYRFNNTSDIKCHFEKFFNSETFAKYSLKINMLVNENYMAL